MKSFTFEGLMAPVFTPITDDGKFNLKLELIPEYMKFLCSSGIRGILVNGTSGEGVSQSVSEREAVAAAWAAARDKEAPDTCFVVQIGGAPLPDVLRLVAHAERVGADGVMCLPDPFYRPADVGQLARYLSLVAAAAPKTPLLYYHIPAFTAVNLSMSELLVRCTAEVPRFAGLKFTSADLQELGRCLEVARTHPQLRVFLGCDDLLLPAYTLGCRCSIATTFSLAPQLALELDRHMRSGSELESAKTLQQHISQLVKAVSRGGGLGTWVPTMKAAMGCLHPTLDMGPPRPPQFPISEQHRNDMKQDLHLLFKK